MFVSALIRRRRRAFSWIVLATGTFLFLCLWNFNSLDGNSPYTSFHRFRLFGGVNEEELPANFYKLPADDPALVDIVRNRFVGPPLSQVYNLTRPDQLDFSRGQSPVIDTALKEKENGYFLECGAYDGEHQSVTLFFERKRNWRGLLIEPNRERYNRIIKKYRQAHVINACVRTDIENFQRPEKSTEMNAYFEGKPKDDPQSVPCFWITTLLLATERKTIDLISLDLSGKETALLKTVDFSNFNIRTITMEIDMSLQNSAIMELLDYMRKRGFHAIHQFSDLVRKTKDIILQKEV